MPFMFQRYLSSCPFDYPCLGDKLQHLERRSTSAVHTVYTAEYPYHPRMPPTYPAAFSRNGRIGYPSTLVELGR